MSNRKARSTARLLSVGLILALLVLVSGFASARPQAITTFFVQKAKLTASDGAEGHYFGNSVSVSGDTVIVGAPTDELMYMLGSVYLFERDAGGANNWGQVTKLTASDGAEGDSFGWSVSASGDTVVIGAPGDDGTSNDFGSAYVFERDEGGLGNWGQVAKLTASDGVASARFGNSVSISGDTVAVGAPIMYVGPGSVYLFERDAGGANNWGQVTKLTASDGAEGDAFGTSVSINSDTVVVSAQGDDDSGPFSGSAYVFERDAGGAGNWGQVAKLTASDGAVDHYFGWSVSASGDSVIIGSLQSGSAYAFEKPGAGWADMTETAKLTASDGTQGDYFGTYVSISSDTVAVGAGWGVNNGIHSGSAYIFEKPGAIWADMTETAKLTASDGAEYDSFGSSVSIADDIVVVGAKGDDDSGDGSGSAYVFLRFEPAAWVYLPVVLRNAP